MLRVILMLLVAAGLWSPANADDPLSDKPVQGWEATGPAFWIELQLDLIRRDRPMPTVHARNLFHVSAAMHDAWAAFDPQVGSMLTDQPTDLPAEDRLVRIAVGHAALTMLQHRYALTNRDGLALLKFERTIRDHGLRDSLEGLDAQAAALGTRIAQSIIEMSLDDGSNELGRYLNNTTYRPVNAPIDPWQSGTELKDPDRWQQIIVYGRSQRPATPQWSSVRPFAISRAEDGKPYLDPGPPPLLNEQDHPVLAAAMVELILISSRLDGRGTGPDADFGRVVAEYWEDGRSSETPPGHWNLLALQAAERTGPPAGTPERMEWEIRLFATLNAALHDAAIACWDIKYHYDSVRPISLIRYMAQLGQSSDPEAGSYHPLGLPLVPGLIELVTEQTAAEGQHHHGLQPGEIAVYCWRGNPTNRNTQISGVGWMPAVSWLPYQDADFITPAFPGYPSGHSTYSAAAAAVLAWHFGTDEVPGGPLEFVAPAGQFLSYERGPSVDIVLSWPRLSDAADQAGRSRIWGGIHPWLNDVAGRKVGQGVAESVIHKMGSLKTP